MAAASQKATPNYAAVVVDTVAEGSGEDDQRRSKVAATATASAVVVKMSGMEAESVSDSAAKPSAKGIQIMPRARTKHPLDPLTSAEISVAVATVRAAGATPEVRDSMRFIEVSLVEPEKLVVALADAYFFPPFQPSLLARTKGGPIIPSKLPPRQARLIVYNKTSNETSIWIIELLEVHATTRGGHHRGKVISSQLVPEVQPAMVEYLKSYSTKRRSKFELLD